MSALTHHDITLLLLGLAILLAAARILAELAQRWHQPAVIGELLAGIILGPTILGALWPSVQQVLFPDTGPINTALHALTTVAITLFMMVAGMEIDISSVWKQGRAALIVGVLGIVIPFAVGFVPAWFAPSALGAKPDSDPLVFALFLATAMAITALPVIAKILMDLNLFRSELGVTIIAAAILNDLFGWIIFALVLAVMGSSAADMPVWQTACLTLLFALFMLTLGRWALNRVLPWIQAHSSWPGGVLGFALACALLCAAFTEFIGVHAIFGAFLFGVALGDSQHLRQRTRATIDHFVSFIFAPLFFASIGLHVNFIRSFDLTLVLIVVALASLGKIVGCTLAAHWAGFPRKEAQAIGFGMNARGAMEIILGLLALQAGIIGDRLFVALVIMALVTSLTSGLFIQRTFRGKRAVRFIDYVSAKTFMPELQARTKQDAIKALGTLAAQSAGIDAEDAVSAVWRREQIVTSAMGNGVAVPHARIAGLKLPIVALGFPSSGVDFDPPDDVPVSVIVLILTPSDANELHLSLLADIARVFQNERMARRLGEGARNLTELRAELNVETSSRLHA